LPFASNTSNDFGDINKKGCSATAPNKTKINYESCNYQNYFAKVQNFNLPKQNSGNKLLTIVQFLIVAGCIIIMKTVYKFIIDDIY